VLTNISKAHLQGFRDIETIRKTKLELLDFVSSVIVNADDPFLMEGIEASGFKGRIIRYGIKCPAEISASAISLKEKGSVFTLHAGGSGSIEVQPKISGTFNIYNILASASAGLLYHVHLMDMKNAIDSFAGVPMRLEFKELNGIKIISDMYNANPASMEESVKELVRVGKERTIAVLGDMLELGSHSEEAHKKLGRLMSELSVDLFIGVGPLMALAASEFSGGIYIVRKAEEAGRILKNIWKKGDSVLIKGSRGMHMEKVLEDVDNINVPEA
jgi:UDP-N-acetylmuramoyl-tripeptide--D-alanyl-D-alanine ligase